ncbi:MAG TPA: hypothetical protein VGL68_01780 [Solirubrobacteraceae bacterium]|jgi:hypothetical protein
MHRRSTSATRIALLSALLALAFATTASAASAIHFQAEGLPALKAQLHNHEVHALTFHPAPAPGHIHVSMSDGRHFTVIYLATEQPQLVALAHASGARYAIAVAKPKAAAKKAHHTLRYIAGGIVIVVILVVAAVLLVDRRRKLNAGGGGQGTPAPGDSAM